MRLLARVEQALQFHFDRVASDSVAPKLVSAMRHAVFSGGARIRPQLAVAVAMACGDDQPELTDAAACAIELMHCASLVHDDLPAFDNADLRRGRPSTHKLFGEPLALLAGDALIVMAFQVLLNARTTQPQRLVELMRNLGSGVGLPVGIVAGQALECEPSADLGTYQRAKTGSLFVTATQAGALACGSDPKPWVALGASLGEAYQVADDIRDVLGQTEALGKPAGQDALHARPSSASALGLTGAIASFESLIEAAVASVPVCSCRGMLQQLVWHESERLVPSKTCAQYHPHPVSVASQRATV
ncbi:MAG: polyprenyl synthetase family protein [Rhodoferax sp.]|nr:polyprenyl synthetase family protein [Rhodoferax sp.]